MDRLRLQFRHVSYLSVIAFKMLKHIVEHADIAILRIDIEYIGNVNVLRAITDALGRNNDAQAGGSSINRRRADAAARDATGHDDGVNAR
ncbi:MAG: hypothetical protein QOF70_1368 [Acetobacteraceae bacterium]|nr:hypothetical protein [Acetobacteraceae bacterium]